MPLGTPPTDDALFYDTFIGSAGNLAGHVPDFNVAGDAAWDTGAEQESGTSWVDVPYDEETTFPAVLDGVGGITSSDDFYQAWPRVLYPGTDPLTDEPYAQPVEVTAERFVLEVDVKLDFSSSLPPEAADGIFFVQLGRRGYYDSEEGPSGPVTFGPYAEFSLRYFMGNYRLLLRAGDAVQDFFGDVTFEPGIVYTLRLACTPEGVTLTGFGTERFVDSMSGPAFDAVPVENKSAFGPLFIGLTDHVVISRVLIESLPPPAPTGVAFWTSLVGAREIVGGSDVPDGGVPDATSVDAPYEETLGALDGTVQWYSVELGAGVWKFSTADSPNGSDYDTYLALFNEGGTLIAQNEDVDSDGGDFRSEISQSLPAGIYYLALSTFEGAAETGFLVTPGDTVVPSGTVLKIEAA